MDDDMFEDAAELVGILGKMMKRGLGGTSTPGSGTGSTPRVAETSTPGTTPRSTPRAGRIDIFDKGLPELPKER